MMTALILLAALQTNEQVLESYRKASEHVTRGAYAEGLRLCDELVKLRPDKEGVIRVRVGAGNEDREFEPRRLAGDASLHLAKNTAELEARLKLVEDAIKWYQASVDLKLKKSEKLLETAKGERTKAAADLEGAKGAELMRRKLEAVKKDITEKVIAREFEAAYAQLEKSRPQFAGNETAWEGLKADLNAEFQRWHEGLLAEARRDLEALKAAQVLANPAPTAERLARYRIPAERAAVTRLNPLLGWAARLGALVEAKPLNVPAAEALAAEGLRLGVAPWKAAAGVALESLASAVKDPGAGASLEQRWESATKSQAAFSAALDRARALATAAAKDAAPAAREDLQKWIAEELPAYDQRVAKVIKALPDRDAPKAVESCLARLENPAILIGARPDGYAAVEAELKELVGRATLEAPLRARVLSAIVVARAYAQFLQGATRDEVLDRCRATAREAAAADAAALDLWKAKVSPRVAWVIDQAR